MQGRNNKTFSPRVYWSEIRVRAIAADCRCRLSTLRGHATCLLLCIPSASRPQIPTLVAQCSTRTISLRLPLSYAAVQKYVPSSPHPKFGWYSLQMKRCICVCAAVKNTVQVLEKMCQAVLDAHRLICLSICSNSESAIPITWSML